MYKVNAAMEQRF